MYLIWWWNVECLILLLKKMILEDAKVSSFSSDFQTRIKIILIPCTNWVRSLFQRLRIEFFPLVYGPYNSHVAIYQQENQGSVFLLLLCMGKGGHLVKCDPQNLNLEMSVFKERGNQSTQRQTSWSKGENQQQTQPTYGIHSGIWTWATLVGSSALTSSPSFFSVISQYICYRIVDDKTNWLWQFFSHRILKAEDKIREGIEPLSKAANLFVKLKR